MKKIIIIILFLAGFLFTAKSAYAQSFSFSPSSAAKGVGESFTVNVNIDIGSSKSRGADLKLSYDEEMLDVSVEKGGYYPIGGKNIANGVIYLSYGVEQSLSPKTGSGLYAKITLKGKAAGAAVLEVVCSNQTTDSNIWNEANEDIIECDDIDDPSYTILAASDEEEEEEETPTATATPTPPVSGVILPTIFSLGVGLILTIMGFALIL